MQQPQHRRSSSSERDDDLLLFLDLQKKEEAEPVQKAPSLKTLGGEDIFSPSEWDQHDYDWLMVPPATALIPTLDHHEFVGNGFALTPSVNIQNPTSVAITKLGSGRLESFSRAEPSVQVVHRSVVSQDSSVAITSVSSLTFQRSSCSSSNQITATGTSSMPARSSTPVSRFIARPSTPTRSGSGAGMCSSRPTGQRTMPSNHSINSSARPSTPIKRPATPTRAINPSSSAEKLSSSSKQTAMASSVRPSTPVRRPATPPHVNNPSCSSGKTLLSSSKQSALASKSAFSSHPRHPSTGRPQQLICQPAAVAGVLQQQPSNFCIDRSPYNPRALKSGATLVVKPIQSESADGAARTKHPSSSPRVTRGRLSLESPNGHKSAVPKIGQPDETGKVSLFTGTGTGSKMVDRCMPPRKPLLAVSQETVPLSRAIDPQPVKSHRPASLGDVKLMARAQASTGFGQNLSKQILGTASRHMNIRGGNTSSFQSFMANVPMSSLYNVTSRNGRGNSSSSNASSPMATSSNVSSEHGMSVCNDPKSSDYFDETSSDMCSRALTLSHCESTMAFCNERLGSPGYLDVGGADVLPIFEQGFASLSGPESPLISQQEGILDCDEFILESMYVG
ncbi:hypothetical protein L7F22_059449 [Adiantum nelumboides]|nr:hypothetical protein [Adiantum nelumboides]